MADDPEMRNGFPDRTEFESYVTKQQLAQDFERLSERLYGVEDRRDATKSRIEIMKDELRGDLRMAMDRIDGLRELLERSRDEERRERSADQQLLYALVKDHNRRLRAIERLERRRSSAT
jgi:hypothetical protein